MAKLVKLNVLLIKMNHLMCGQRVGEDDNCKNTATRVSRIYESFDYEWLEPWAEFDIESLDS